MMPAEDLPGITEKTSCLFFIHFVPHTDPASLLAAFSGALVYIINAEEITLWKKIIYLPVSTIIGEMAAEELLVNSPVGTKSVAAFICGAVVIVLLLRIIDLVKNIDSIGFFKRK